MPFLIKPNNITRSRRTIYRWREKKAKLIQLANDSRSTSINDDNVGNSQPSDPLNYAMVVDSSLSNAEIAPVSSRDESVSPPNVEVQNEFQQENIDIVMSNDDDDDDDDHDDNLLLSNNEIPPILNVSSREGSISPPTVEVQNEIHYEDVDDIIMSNDDDEAAPNLDNKVSHKVRALFRRWGTRHRITREAGNELLQLLKDEDVVSHIPDLKIKDWRGIRTIPSKQRYFNPEVENKWGGEFAYLGIATNLKSSRRGNFFFNPTKDVISLSFNIDGVPLSESSKSSFFPILGKCEEANVFLIALYYSKEKSKPDDMNAYLSYFVVEVKNLEVNGININGKHYQFEVKNMICDAIAKASVLNIKSPTGYFSCPKCTVPGRKRTRVIPGQRRKNGGQKTKKSNTYFLDLDQPERKHEHFNSLSSGVEGDDFFHGYTVLREISSLDLVRDVVVDELHTVYLGIVKKLLEALMDGYVDPSSDKRRKPTLRSVDKQQICHFLDYLRTHHFCPADFARKPRGIDLKPHWKSTEFRQFLLYICSTVLKKYLPETHYNLITILVVAIRILSTHEELDLVKINYAGELLDYFIENCAEIFGETFIVHIPHMLHHLRQDVINFGPLPEFSASPFEDFNFQLTQNVTSGNKPVQQVIRWYNESVDAGMFAFKTKRCPQKEPGCSETHLQTDKFLFRTDRQGDRYCSIGTGRHHQIVRIDSLEREVDGTVKVSGKPFVKSKSLFRFPCSSKEVQIFKCRNILSASSVQFSPSDITGKFYPIPHSEEEKEFTMAKLLH